MLSVWTYIYSYIFLYKWLNRARIWTKQLRLFIVRNKKKKLKNQSPRFIYFYSLNNAFIKPVLRNKNKGIGEPHLSFFD